MKPPPRDCRLALSFAFGSRRAPKPAVNRPQTSTAAELVGLVSYEIKPN
jgi:hypothetical protein